MKIINYIGNTPMVKIENIYDNKKADVFVKLEEFNPGGSIKSRAGIQMVFDAYHQRKLEGNKAILEPTGGNTGIGIMLAAITLGCHVILVIPDNFSKEKIKTLKNYGAEIILSSHQSGPGSHIRLVKEMLKDFPSKYLFLDQFSNPSNPKSHYLRTAPEIKKQLSGKKIEAFVAGIGTGGTLMGIGQYLKKINPTTKIIGVQPQGCNIKEGHFIPHKIEAISVGIVPSILNFDIIDHIIDINFNELSELRGWLIKKYGLFVGISSVSNILAALKEACHYEKGKTVVTIAPDSGRSYLDYQW